MAPIKKPITEQRLRDKGYISKTEVAAGLRQIADDVVNRLPDNVMMKYEINFRFAYPDPR